MEPDVRELLRRGEKNRAFERILDLYEAKVFRLVLSLVRDVARTEEVTQDSFLKVWQALERLDDRAGVGTWIYSIARNTALTYLRAESYRRTAPLESIGEPAAAAAGGDCGIRQLVEKLPEEQREAVVLYYYQERSVEEVALMLDLPEGTVKSHLFRARKQLGEWMERS